MKVKDLLDVCEQFEFMAQKGREAAAGIHPDAEVPETPENEGLLYISGWMNRCKPKENST